MNVRALLRATVVAAPWLVLHCGDSKDLVIGRWQESNAVLPDASNGGGDAQPETDVVVPPIGGAGGAGAGAQAGAGDAGGSGGEGNVVVNCTPGELPPAASLLHRWDFSGTGLVAVDSVGGADGEIIGPHEMDDDGVLDFTGDTDSYVNLPNGIVSALTDATFVAWTRWDGGAAWQRIFDFGFNQNGEDQRGNGDDFFALMHMPSPDDSDLGFLQLELDTPDPGALGLSTEPDLPKYVEHQYAVTVQSGVEINLFINGEHAGVLMTTALLADVDDRNNWFGRSNFSGDHAYDGAFNEFRIYGAALSSCAIETLHEAGPDVLP